MSSVVVLDLKQPEYGRDVLDQALVLASQGLTRARKMLTNAFSPRLEAAEIEAAGLDPTSRPGTITLAGWVNLAKVLKKAP
jgi:16S rRNA A1518/A1519 N6-dimethyltransferase RsmA/KsgA/DIM1 with predicted DNA glycosylase/AP lyase activity